MKQYLKYKRKSGVPIGYKESWKYVGRWNEKPVKRLRNGKKLWVVRFKATKSRPASSYGSFGKGTVGRWKIFGYQDIKKIGKGKYITDLKAFKTPVFFKVKKPRRWR